VLNISSILLFKYPQARLLVDYQITDDGKGQFISLWNEKTLGPQPTVDDLTNISNSADYLNSILNPPDTRSERDKAIDALIVANQTLMTGIDLTKAVINQKLLNPVNPVNPGVVNNAK
jgi:hypothetical protein